jgi:uncharacterized protein (TIGR02996 family)
MMADAEREGLLRAIIENPEDDTPRLVYADWLEEHGDPDRAEFIRIGCQKEREEFDSPRWNELKARASEMEYRNRKRWLKDLPELPKRFSWWDWRRGFVEGLSVPGLAPFQREEKRLRSTIPLLSLALTVGTNFKSFEKATCLKGLRRLLVGGRLGDVGVGSLGRCSHLAGVRELTLHGHGITPVGARYLADSPHLADLTFLELGANHGIGDEGARAIAQSVHLTRLTRLNLYNADIGNEGLAALASSGNLFGLTHLLLMNNRISDAGARALADSPAPRRLRVLDLENNQIGESGAIALAGSARLAGLASLVLKRNRIGPVAGVTLVRSAHLRSLRNLDLDGCEIGDEGAVALAESANVASVRSLDLGRNEITDTGAIALARSPHLAGVEKLDLGSNRIGDAGARALALSEYLRPREPILLSGNSVSQDVFIEYKGRIEKRW